MNRTDLLKMFLGVTIIVTLGFIDWNVWHSTQIYMIRHNTHKALIVGTGLTLLWMYWKWENRG